MSIGESQQLPLGIALGCLRLAHSDIRQSRFCEGIDSYYFAFLGERPSARVSIYRWLVDVLDVGAGA